jgi:uncharacterized protein
MQPYEQRVIAEKSELDDRIASLASFLKTDTFAALGAPARSLLWEQLNAMRSLSGILGKRIAGFNIEVDIQCAHAQEDHLTTEEVVGDGLYIDTSDGTTGENVTINLTRDTANVLRNRLTRFIDGGDRS